MTRSGPRRSAEPPSPDPSDDGPEPGVRLVAAMAIRRGDRLLVIREEDEPHRHEWVLPQGYPRPGESLPDAARCEAYEEVGIDVEVVGLVGVYEQFDPGSPGARWLTVCYLGRPVHGRAPVATREAIDSAWIDPTAVDPGSLPALRPMLDDLRRAFAG